MPIADIHPPQIADPAPAGEILILDRRLPTRLISFLGLDFVPMDAQTLFTRVSEAADQQDEFRYLVTPNVDQIVRLDAQPNLRPLFDDAWVTINDSRIIELLARWSRLTLPACPGSDLVKRIMEESIDPVEPLVIIGCSQAVIDAISARYGLTCVHWYQPPMGLRTNPEAIAAAAQFCINHPARFTFICVGNPQQEMVAQAIKRTGGAKGIGLCVGASFEFLAGTRKRAPFWMQKLRLEWLFRLISEPNLLWRRYLVDGPKVFAIWQKWRANAQ